MAEVQLNILVLDDDPVIINLFKSILKDKVTLFTASLPSVAFRILKNEPVDILISDFRLPEMDGLAVISKVKKEYSDVDIIMISSEGDMDTVIEAMRKGAMDYFRKPFAPVDIWIAIERSKKYAELNADLEKYKSKNRFLSDVIDKSFFDEMIGETPVIVEVKTQMHQVAETHDTSVLILGESGTGKELVARGIHKLSKRRDEVFGAVNMSALPESLFESEFFGHKKGSFTGAVSDKPGWFEVTNKGTLFFDEIGEMNQSLQVKLLRVLEDRKYTMVGTQKEKSFDTRIISATNKTEDDMSAGKSFRSDLYYRLGTFTIYLPSLRERKDDIPLLVNHFFTTMVKKMRKDIKRVHPEAVEMLRQYDFPGNIRELRNMMERAIIICNNSEIDPSHFHQGLRKDSSSQVKVSDNFASEIFDLGELEKQAIIKALNKSNNNKNEAARLLNIEWNALHRRIQKYNL